MTYTSIQQLIEDKTWVRPSNFAQWSDERLEDYVVGFAEARDSGILDQSNFATALDALGGESKSVKVFRFSHWAGGHYEQIFVKKTAKAKLKILMGLYNQYENYPVLDESDYSEREQEYMTDTFSSFEDDFIRELDNVLSVWGHDHTEFKDEEVRELLQLIYEDDCSYQGTEDGYVSDRAIERYMTNKWNATYLETNGLYNFLHPLMRRGVK